MRFLQSASLTLIFKFLAIAFGLGASIVISRTLGPTGRGIYGLIMTLIMLVTTFGTFGINTANTYFISKEQRYARLLGKRSLIVGFIGGIISTTIVLILNLIKPTVFQGMSFSLLILTMIIVLFYLWGRFFSQGYLGRNNIIAFNLFTFAERFIFFISAVVMLLLFNGSIDQYVSVVMILLALFVGGYIWHYFKSSASDQPPDQLPFWESLLYGIKPYTAALFTMLTLRSGLFFINSMMDTEATGLFAVAQQMSEVLIIFPSVVGSVLFPRVASDNSTHLTAQVIRTTALVFVPVFIGIAFFAEPLIVLLFGPEFKDAATALLILLPGTYLLGLEVIIAGDISGRGYPWPASLIWILVVAINFSGYMILIPKFGINGAALSLSISYLVIFIFMTFYLKRLTSLKFSQMFIPKKADFIKLKQFSKDALTRS